MTRSTFYYNRRDKSDKWSVERAEVASIFYENCGRYGYRRITSEMRNRGYIINHKTVQKLMKESELKCLVRIKKYRSYKGGNWQDRTKYHCPQLLRRQAFTEVGYRCYGVLLIWSKEVFVTRF